MARNITVALELDNKDFNNNLRSSTQQVDGLGKKLGGLKTAVGALAFGAASKGIIDATVKMETYRSTLTAYLGTQDAANDALSRLSTLANKLPQDLDDVTESFLVLQRNGIDTANESLEAFAKVAAGNGKSMSQLAEGVADALTGEFERLKEFGVKVSKENDKFVVRMADGSKQIVNSAREVVEAVKAQGEEGGKFADVVAGPLNQAFSNLRGITLEVSAAFGDGLAPALSDASTRIKESLAANKEFIASLGELAGDAMAAVIENLDIIVPLLAGFAGALVVSKVIAFAQGIQTLVVAVKALSLAAAANPIGLIITGVVAAGVALATFINQVGDVKIAFMKMANGAAEAMNKVIGFFTNREPIAIPFTAEVLEYEQFQAQMESLTEVVVTAQRKTAEVIERTAEVDMVAAEKAVEASKKRLKETEKQHKQNDRMLEQLQKADEKKTEMYEREKARAEGVLVASQVQLEADLRDIQTTVEKIGLTDVEIAQLETTNALNAQRNEKLAEIAKYNISDAEKNALKEQLIALYDEELVRQLDAIAQTDEQQRRFSTGWLDAHAAYTDSATDMAAVGTRVFDTFTGGMEDAIVRFAETGKLSFKDLIKTMISEITRFLAKQIVKKFLDLLTGGIGGSVLSIFGFDAGGYIPAGKAGIVGEKGPEIVQGPAMVTGRTTTAALMKQTASDMAGGGSGSGTVNYYISAVDTDSFRRLVAQDPEYIYNVTQAGRRTTI